MGSQQQSLSDLQDIKRIMERSSRFISLSGLSGVAAGCLGLASSFIAYNWIYSYYTVYNGRGTWAVGDLYNWNGNFFSCRRYTGACTACWFLFYLEKSKKKQCSYLEQQ